MAELGYFLSSEEHRPQCLLEQARLAEEAGIESVWISDHYHPWLHEQGESPFVWSVIGAIGATTQLTVSTAVTCPTFRIHPAVVAHAAATSAVLLDGRFELGVGSGENLNEHILGDRWPATDMRLEMLEEAVGIMRALWTGEEVSHRGEYYEVEDARIYTLPDGPIPVMMSGFGPKSTDLAARIADGYAHTQPAKELVERYRKGGGEGLISGGVKVCWGPDRDECVERAHRLWRTSGVPGELSQDLRTPGLFEQAASNVTPEQVGESFACGPDVQPIVDNVKAMVDAGFDRIYLSQMGENQQEFFRFLRDELVGELASIGVTPGRAAR